MGQENTATPTLLFDGNCRLCRAFASLVRRWDFRSDLRVLPFHLEEARRFLPGWADERIEKSAHLVLPGGKVLSGPQAFAALLDHLPVVGPLHRRWAHRTTVQWLERTMYTTAVALRGATSCASPRLSAPS